MSFETGDTIGAYKVVGVLGSGGMGQVLKIEHTITKRVEAMKVLMDRQSNAQEVAQRFLREIQVQASLAHPNIASVHNAFWVNDDLVMVMELVEGDSLQRLLERGPIPLRAAIDYVCQVLSALSYAHAQGVVHRDVSPANIIVTPDGTVKLTDFGLARAPKDPRVTQVGALVGSLYYMPPEQVKGSSMLDPRMDIYSCGAVLYELVTNKKPFDLENDFSMMLAHVERTPAPPIEINHYTPPALNDIILTALAKEPEGRFQSADLFRDNLLEVKKIVAVEDEDAPALQSAFGIAPWKPLLSRLACAATHSRALKYSVAIVLLSLTVSLFGIWRQASFQRTTTSKVAPAMASKAPAPSSSKAAEIPAPVAIPTAQPNSPFAAYRIEVSDSVPSGFKNVANSAPLVAPKSVAGKASAITVSTDLLSEPKALAAKPVREAINEVPLTPPSLHYEPPKETVATVSKEPPADPQPKEKKGNRFRKALSAVLHPYKRKSSDRSGMSAGAIRESRPGDINGETEVPKR